MENNQQQKVQNMIDESTQKEFGIMPRGQQGYQQMQVPVQQQVVQQQNTQQTDSLKDELGIKNLPQTGGGDPLSHLAGFTGVSDSNAPQGQQQFEYQTQPMSQMRAEQQQQQVPVQQQVVQQQNTQPATERPVMNMQEMSQNNTVMPQNIQQQNQVQQQVQQEQTQVQNQQQVVNNPTGQIQVREEEHVPSVQERRQRVKEIIKGITVDLNNIDIVDETPLTKVDDFEFILKGASTFQVVANQSHYIAFMEALKMIDINIITNSTNDIYHDRSLMYKTVHSKINTTSLGKLSFQDWLKITSFFDFPTILYGVYAQTFPGNTDFQIECRHCEKTVDVTVNNDTLVAIKNDESFQNISEVIASIKSPKQALEKSLVNKTTRGLLPDSKIIINVQTPSLYDHLSLLSSVDREKAKQLMDILSTLLFIKSVFMLDVQKTVDSGKPKYYEITDRNEILGILKELSLDDAKELAEVVNKRTDEFGIDYKIKNFQCPKCHKGIGDIPVDIEQLLFHQLLRH